jgi:hypothetical protein
VLIQEEEEEAEETEEEDLDEAILNALARNTATIPTRVPDNFPYT